MKHNLTLKTLLASAFIATAFIAPLAHAQTTPGGSCGYPEPNGTQPGIFDVNGQCVPNPANCDPATMTCVAAGCNPVTTSCEIQHPPAQQPTDTGPSSGFVALAPIPGLTEGEVADQTNLAAFFNNLYKYLIGLAAAAAIIEIIWGALEMILNRDNVSKILDSKGRISRAIQGLILVLTPTLVFSIINPAILNLSVSLKPINVTATPPINALPPAPATGCTKVASRSSIYLETYVCASLSDARDTLDSLCGTDLNPVLPLSEKPCAKDQTGKCVSTQPVTAYCAGTKNITATALYYYNVLLTFSRWLPTSESTVTEFKSVCRSSGGSVRETFSLGSYAITNSELFRLKTFCPADFEFTYDSASYSGGVCLDKVLYCDPPSF